MSSQRWWLRYWWPGARRTTRPSPQNIKPRITNRSPRQARNSAPCQPPCSVTVLSEAGAAEVIDAVRDTTSGRVVYKIYFRDHNVYPPLLVSPDGSVLNDDLTVAVSAVHGTRVKLAEVPAKVLKAIPEHAPAGEVAFINKETWGGRVVYVVTFKDEAHTPKLLIAEDGSRVEETP